MVLILSRCVPGGVIVTPDANRPSPVAGCARRGVGRCGVVVLSYAQYCRHRALLRRLEGRADAWTTHAVVIAAIGGGLPGGGLPDGGASGRASGGTRVLFCRNTFEHPLLQEHELRRDHLGRTGGDTWQNQIETR